MQGSMIMPMFAYHADHGHLHVTMPTNIPQLTPLLVSHPGDNFDPSDPWFANLDPSAQGYSFSRRYGWVMHGSSDPLPPNTAIWIRKLSGSPELGFYRYSGTPPKAWEPIYGTAGSPNARMWNGMMFHPGVSAPPGTNPLSATFEAYLVDMTTSNEIPGSSTGPFVLHFTNVNDGRPALSATLKMAVQWDPAATNWALEWATSPTSTMWIAATNVPVVIDGSKTTLMELDGASKVFRLRRTP
jgi:hypothetical protein